MAESESKDFFISYNKADRGWAEWIAWQLEAEGYTIVLQAWDFRPGGNFILQMDEATKQAKRTIAVLSPSYIASSFTQPEWTAAFSQDPTGKQGKLLPVRVRNCELDGLLKQIVYIDLVGLDKIAAGNALRAGVRQSRALPALEPLYPGETPSPLPPLPSFPGNWPAVWNIPYDRNPFFTGREQLLTHLHESLFATTSMALTQRRAINGLGGIGKTQTAIEYAYRYGQEYQVVLWVSAATEETFLTEFGQLATLLQLPECDTKEQAVIVQAVITWLAEQRHWLLILDNADDLAMVKAYLPGGYKTDGHLLLTTRTKYAGSIAQPIEVEIMDQEEGITLLLRRAGCIAPNTSLELADPKDRTDAQAIVNVLGGLPLALDQAGAYIEETQCSLPTYLSLYQTHRKELLQQRSTLPSNHPESVATTWKLSFERVEQTNPAAADLLRICAFLDPDTIPEDLFVKGASELGPALAIGPMDVFHLNAIIKELLAYSLVRRNADDQILSIHRLVQAVLKDEMDMPTQQQWAERVVRTINIVFPSERWLPIKSLLLNALACAHLIENYHLSFPEASRLLDRTATYLQDAARYPEAEPLFLRSLAIYEKALGPDHPSTSATQGNLALLYKDQGRYPEAELLFLRSLAIKEKALGPDHPDTSTTLNNLALLYKDQGRYPEAELLFLRSLAIKEKTLGPDHPSTSITQGNLALLYQAQGRYPEAEPLFLHSLAIKEKALGPDHPDISTTQGNLALLYQAQGRYPEAEPLFLRSLAIDEKTLGPDHPDTSTTLNNLALLYQAQGRYPEAEPLFLHSLAIYEKALGPDHPSTSITQGNLARLYQDQGRYPEAEPLFLRSLAIKEKTLGPDHPDTSTTLNNLALLYQAQGRYPEAELLFLRSLAIKEKALGPDHPDTSTTLNNLALLYQDQGQYPEAEPLFLRSLAIKEKTLGPDHPSMGIALYNLAWLYQAQERYQEAELLYQRVLSIDTKRFGPEHLEVAVDLENYAHLLQKMDRSDEAMQLQERAQTIRDKQ